MMSHSNGMSTVDILTRLRCAILGPIIIIAVTVGLSATATLADPGRHHVNNNFQSVPTTVKTFANDTVMLPCNHKSECRRSGLFVAATGCGPVYGCFILAYKLPYITRKAPPTDRRDAMRIFMLPFRTERNRTNDAFMLYVVSS